LPLPTWQGPFAKSTERDGSRPFREYEIQG
jgi:hypothetical protein